MNRSFSETPPHMECSFTQLRQTLAITLSGLVISTGAVSCLAHQGDNSFKSIPATSTLSTKKTTQPTNTPLSEWLPEYPVSKKLAIIINGDSREARHIENVQRAVETLKERNFNEFYIVADQVIQQEAITLHQFKGSMAGLDEAFASLGAEGILIKDALTFFYVTGHGKMQGGESCIVMSDGCYPKSRFVERLDVLKKAEARGIFVMDECSGFANAIIDSGVQGVAMSETREGFAALCDTFAKPLFDAFKARFDSNGDGVAEPIEAFHKAMAEYNSSTGRGDLGEYRESRSELTLDNFENHNNKTLVIKVSATWCDICKQYSRTLDDVNAMVGEQINVINLTTDTNPETEALMKMIGVRNSKTFPTTVILTPAGERLVLTGLLSRDQLMQHLTPLGVKPNVTIYENVLVEQSGKSKAVVQLFIRAGILNGELIQLGDNPSSAVENALEKAPWLILQNASQLRPIIPDFESSFRQALSSCLDKEPMGVLQFARSFLNHPFAKGAILTAAEKDIGSALIFATEYEAHPQFREILEGIGLIAIGQVPDIQKSRDFNDLFERHSVTLNPFKNRAYAENWLSGYGGHATFEKNLMENLPVLLEQSWFDSVLVKLLENKTLFTSNLGASVLKNLSQFEKLPSFHKIPKAALTLQENDPDIFFRYLQIESGWESWPFSRAMGLRHPWIAALCLGEAYKKQPWAGFNPARASKRLVVQEIGQRYRSQYEGEAFDLFDFYKDEPWAMEELQKMAFRNPETIAQKQSRLYLIINEPWAEKFVRDTESKRPGTLYYKLKALENKPEWLQHFIQERAEWEAEQRKE